MSATARGAWTEMKEVKQRLMTRLGMGGAGDSYEYICCSKTDDSVV